jgi:hypothetical protein
MSTTELFPYPNYDDLARLEYGRMLWRDPLWRDRLRRHWLDERHPHRERFLEQQLLVEELLSDVRSDLGELDADLRRRGTSLRATMREIPPVFGGFFEP